ncbi:MAG: hypothetical protein E7609_04670 [Ruminococcaceae bacterium]|nr:hypothetical protein [Oscillospiraceae bacterium]
MKEPISKMRKNYISRLSARFIIFVFFVFLFLFKPQFFSVLEGGRFFTELSPLHLLWVIWMFDMLCQLVPVWKKLPVGSGKLFRGRFRPIRETVNYEALRSHIIAATRAAYKVFLLWIGLLSVIAALYYTHVIGKEILFLISACFYVCDLICVLIWCPFRLIMKNKCCTTCRIFNWDHLMMMSPMVFIGGFYSVSLILAAIAVFLLWETCILMYPERFWEQSNAALKCSECTDKLCTQYCRKLRK